MFSEASVSHFVHRGNVRGGGACMAGGACVVRGMHGRGGGMHGRGVHGRGVYMAGGHV